MNGFHNASQFYFAWPAVLLLLLLIPIWWIFYLRQQRQRIQQLAMQFSYTAVVEQLQKQPAVWKRLLFPIGASLLMACLMVGLARPTVVAKVPVNSVDMMLVMDISLSMLAEDIKPDRITAAKEAAVRFVENMPRDVRVGLEVFAGDNYVLSPPTSKHGEVVTYLKALRREDLKPRTEIGTALHTALKILETDAAVSTDETKSSASKPIQPSSQPPKQKADRVIVLLSDGDSHEGYPWDQAARDAKAQGVIVHAIGIGSAEGTTIMYQGLELPVIFSEATLREIAAIGGGSYFRVLSAADFRTVYEQIHDRTVHYEEQAIDLAFVCAGVALLLLSLSFAVSRRVI